MQDESSLIPLQFWTIKKFDAYEKMVLGFLNCSQSRNSFSMEKIAKLTGISRTKVTKSIKRLIKDGYVTEGEGCSRYGIIYRVNWPKILDT